MLHHLFGVYKYRYKVYIFRKLIFMEANITSALNIAVAGACIHLVLLQIVRAAGSV